MNDFWRTLPRDEDGRWTEDGIPNMATRKKTDDEKATDQREIQTGDAADSSTNSTDGSGTDDATTESEQTGSAKSGFGSEDAHTQGSDDPHASDSDLPPFTGVDGTAFPDRAEPILSDQTETVTNDAGTEFEQPKFRAVRNGQTDVIGISLYNWVGPEALTLPGSDLDDFKKFVASL